MTIIALLPVSLRSRYNPLRASLGFVFVELRVMDPFSFMTWTFRLGLHFMVLLWFRSMIGLSVVSRELHLMLQFLA